MGKSLIYLASPYSDPNAEVRRRRYIGAACAAAKLTKAGLLVYSPITHCHPMAIYGGLSGDWAFWEDIAREWLRRCDRVMVLMLDGWRESVGVVHEVEYARTLGKPVEYLEYDVPENDLL